MVPGTKEIELGDIDGEEKYAAAKTNQAEITIDEKTEKDASVVQQAVVIVDEKKEENEIIVKQAEVTVDEKKEENTVVVMQFEITVHEKKEEDATELEATYGGAPSIFSTWKMPTKISPRSYQGGRWRC
jgi:hypothetical protein